MPLAFILVAVSVPKPALAARLAVKPLTLILAAIRPDLCPVNLPNPIFVDVALIDGPRFWRVKLLRFYEV